MHGAADLSDLPGSAPPRDPNLTKALATAFHCAVLSGFVDFAIVRQWVSVYAGRSLLGEPEAVAADGSGIRVAMNADYGVDARRESVAGLGSDT
jgi:hypothetical protein